VPGDEILYLQSSALGRLQGASEEVIAWDRAIRQRVYEQVKSETDGVADAAGRRALMADLPPLPGTADPEGGRSLATTLLQAASGPWFRHFLAYDPAPTIARVTCPVLAIIGEKDVQVPPRENLPAIERALQSSPNPDYTVMPVPQLNHLFQTSATGSPAEYGSIEETFAPSALTLVSDWIVARVGR
jgi:hypothetical protein